MTAKITISLSDDLKRLITEYNKRHPFEPLIISKIAQKAVFEKIKNQDPELLTTTYTLLPKVTHNINEYPEIKTQEVKPREIILEEELAKPAQEKQHRVVCAECKQKFTAERSTRKFCSGKCKTAYGRKHKPIA